jgi:uncharacterized sulfatase
MIRLLTVLLAALAVAAPAAGAEQKKLNVLFIAVDDLNCATGTDGHPLVRTPNLDRLAARGVRFSRAYCQYPLCNPSRTSLLSGRLPDSTRIFDNNTPPRQYLGKDVVFLPEHFGVNGYFTARAGKIAHGRYEDHVRWSVTGRPGKAKRNQVAEVLQPKQGGAMKISWRATNRNDEDEPDGRTARLIAQRMEKNRDRPFFLAAGFKKPHLPFVAPRKYFDLYPLERIALPKERADVRKGVPAVAFTRTKGDEAMTDKDKKEAIRAYYACVSFVDAQLGVLLDALDRLKLWDSTVVVFFSDHGFLLGEHGGLWRKMCLFEESVRVPLVVAAPGKKAGAVCGRVVELLDLYPTLCELCHLKAPEGLQGTSLVPLLEDPKAAWKRQAAYTVVSRGKGLLGRSVRTQRHRYTEWGGADRAELYDHDRDPHEQVNLANQPEHRKLLEQMRRLLRQHSKSEAR